jgi:hypothetical protein
MRCGCVRNQRSDVFFRGAGGRGSHVKTHNAIRTSGSVQAPESAAHFSFPCLWERRAYKKVVHQAEKRDGSCDSFDALVLHSASPHIIRHQPDSAPQLSKRASVEGGKNGKPGEGPLPPLHCPKREAVDAERVREPVRVRHHVPERGGALSHPTVVSTPRKSAPQQRHRQHARHCKRKAFALHQLERIGRDRQLLRGRGGSGPWVPQSQVRKEKHVGQKCCPCESLSPVPLR